MYLTRLAINRQRRGARELLASPYKLHAAVESSFPPPTEFGGDTKDQHRVLWRVDTGERSTLLYLVSPIPPDLTHVVEQAGWPHANQGWETRDYSRFLESLELGQTWHFRLTANPVRRARRDVKAPVGSEESSSIIGKRLAYVTVHQQMDWLLTRAPRLGFSLPKVDAAPQVTVISRHKLRFAHKPGNPVTVTTATFDGILQVEDTTALRQTLVSGIGPSKAFGCGLMTLAPVKR